MSKFNIEKVKVEKGIPIPETFRPHRFPFHKMDVGDSFLIPEELRSKAGVGARNYRAKNTCWEYRTMKVEEGGVRVWRIA